MNESGKSYSPSNPNGVRRKKNGEALAPRSLRKLGKKYLSECNTSLLEKIAKL